MGAARCWEEKINTKTRCTHSIQSYCTQKWNLIVDSPEVNVVLMT